jgi:uncharacterized membrane protein SpoIIM required for sporulation
MDYARFVRLRSPRWDEFESRLSAAQARPSEVEHAGLEAIALAYRQVLHDHALAAARFPGTAAARRLGALALNGTHWLQRDSRDRLPGPGAFFARTFPVAFRAHLPHLAAAIVLFATALVFGTSLATVQPGAGAALLGPQAIEGLRRGRLWTESLVSTVPPALSSSSIATNNMSVALAGWAGGALLGVGSLYVILLNGFLLGAILATTMHYGLAGALLEFVSAHGPLEITLILVTSAGGLSLGHALVAADDRPRREVLHRASRDALALLVGCLPWFLLLGIVEAVVSPSPAVPVSLKVALGLGLDAAFLTLAWNPLLHRSSESRSS